MYEVGQRIRIVDMEGEPQYTGKEGTIRKIAKDPWGDTVLYGDWGGLSIYPCKDRIEVIS